MVSDEPARMVSDDIAELSRALKHTFAGLFLVIGGVGMGSVPAFSAFGGMLAIVGFLLGVVGVTGVPTGQRSVFAGLLDVTGPVATDEESDGDGPNGSE